jgi:hypothetical protein
MNFDPTAANLSWTPEGGPAVDLGGYVTGVSFERVTEGNFLDGWNKPIRITLRGRSDGLSPLAYRLLLRRNHPRVSRMHGAYRAKRKGW